MKNYYFLLLALVGCGENTAEPQAIGASVASKAPIVQPTLPVQLAIAYASGDREVNGPDDTLHVDNGLVLYLKPGRKSDFAEVPHTPISYSENRVICREGDGRVYRANNTLFIQPFNHAILRFFDDTYQIRGDNNEEEGIQYTFSGGIPGRPYWIVDSLMYEYYHPFLINKYSGCITSLWHVPSISPNRQHILVATPGLDSESSLNGLQLFTISDQTVNPLWTRVLINWQPQRVQWLDNHTIAIEQARFEPQEIITYVRLILPN